MSNPFGTGMEEALRLTREGRLNEATASIQRALGGGTAPPPQQDDPFDTVIELEAPAPNKERAADEAPPTVKTPQRGKTEQRLRPAPKPTRNLQDMLHLPTGLSGLGGLDNLTGLDGLGGLTIGTAPAVSSPAVVPGGEFVGRSYTNRAGTRGYKLYVPSSYAGQEMPLVVMLHGCTQGPEDFAAGTRMNVLAEEHGFLVAYPVQDMGSNNQRCWNWFKAADQRRGEGEPSIIAGITGEVIDEYNVDAGRVYVAGMSAGGAMAAILAATYPDLYAAAGVHSGLAPGAAKDMPTAFAAMQGNGASSAHRAHGKLDRVVPTIVFHGDADRTVHPRNAERLLHHWTAGGPETLVTVHEGRKPGGYAHARAVHSDAEGRTVMEQWSVQGLGHAWSGGSAPGSYTDPKGPDASAEMVRFFVQHPHQ